MIKFRPMGKGVVIKQDEAEEKTEGGIVLAQKSRKAPERGTVVAVGSEVQDVEVGNRVLFETKMCKSLVLSEGDFLITKEAALVAVEEG